ncbi:hypothetical protein [Eremococcus coleocola]|uniref:hypothetical protein n=1 Tax=Eremococcus coleocola TaxID=88132 RepID=UPI0002F21353|nr:hypothetical protein [Eremococcus coleocola]
MRKLLNIIVYICVLFSFSSLVFADENLEIFDSTNKTVNNLKTHFQVRDYEYKKEEETFSKITDQHTITIEFEDEEDPLYICC